MDGDVIASAIALLNEWGPIAWGLAFYALCFMACGCLWLYVMVERRRIINRYKRVGIEHPFNN